MGGGERCRWTPLGMRHPGYEPWLCHASPVLGPPPRPDSSLAPQFQSCCREKKGNSTAGSLMHGLNHSFISLLNYSFTIILSFTHVHFLQCLLIQLLKITHIHSFVHLLMDFFNLFTHSLIHSFSHLLISSFAH